MKTNINKKTNFRKKLVNTTKFTATLLIATILIFGSSVTAILQENNIEIEINNEQENNLEIQAQQNIVENHMDAKPEQVRADHDMGIVSINELESGIAQPFTPTVSVENLGDMDETNIPVNLMIGSFQPINTTSRSFYDFEYYDGGFIPSASWDPIGDWEYTDSYDVSLYTGTHTPPPTAHSGDGMWGTVIYDDYTNAGGTSYLKKTIDLSNIVGASMSFYSWSDIFGSFDYGMVKINGLELLRIETYNPTDWTYEEVDLSAYDGQIVELSFDFYATTVVEYAGWYIDDLTITDVPMQFIPEYNETINIDALSGEIVNATFPTWTPADLGFIENTNRRYTAFAEVNAPGDNDTSNDAMNMTFVLDYLWFHDIGVDEITSPESGIGAVFTPEAIIVNSGMNSETSVPANMKISYENSTGVWIEEYNETIYVDVPFDSSINAIFPDWTPIALGIQENIAINYLVEVEVDCPDDNNTVNDIGSKAFTLTYAYFHDIGIVEIIEPVSGMAGTQTPFVVIENIGQNDETGVGINLKIEKIEVVEAYTQKIYSGTGEWTQSSYGTYTSHEPPGTGTYYTWARDVSGVGFDVGLFTTPFDFSSMTNVTVEFDRNFQDYANYGQAEVRTYSGGKEPANQEEMLLFLTTDDPTSGVHTTLYFDPSTYTDPSEVYIEFWYTDDAYTSTAWSFAIDDLTITSIGYFESFEASFFPPGIYNYIEEYNEDVTVDIAVGEQLNITTFPDWTPADIISTYVDYVVTATSSITTAGSSFYTEDFEGFVPGGPTTTIFESNFTTWPPTDWTIQSISTGTWAQYLYSSAYWARCYEKVNEAQDEWLISPTIDCTALTGTTLSFQKYFYRSTVSGDSDAHVYVSGDNGASWTEVAAWYLSSYLSTEVIDISAIADGNSQVKVAFNFVSTNLTSAYDYFRVYDVKISDWIPDAGWPPAGWTIINNNPPSGEWMLNTMYGRTNYAGGYGYCADADADAHGSAGPWPMDTELITHSIDLSAQTGAMLSFIAAYNYLSGDWFEVDISGDGGYHWDNIMHWAEDHSAYGPGELVSLDISSYCGNSDVKIRFHYYADSWDYYIEVDNITLSEVISLDGNPDNDQLLKWITLEYQHDVGTKEILEPQYPTDRAQWDLLFSYDLEAASGALGNAGAEFANGYFYSTRWASNLIHQYDIYGNLVKEFSITGVTGLRDLAYNPNTGYFYGGAAGGTIWEMDFDSETLVSTITGGFQSRAIAYNEDDDVIYCSNWGDPVWVVDPASGAILDQFNLVSATNTYGLAYDNDGTNRYLYVFDQGTGGGYPQYIYEWDLDGGVMTGNSHDVTIDIPGTAGIAGGLFVTDEYESGKICLGGLMQGTPDMMFVYELREGGGSGAQGYITPGIYPVKAAVENYGTFTETFNVNAKVFFEQEKEDILVYEDNQTVVDLGVGGVAIVDFVDIEFLEGAEWEGNYRFEITTQLAGDEVAGNDQKTKTFLMHAHDTIPPVTIHEFTGTMGDNDWYVSDVTITLTAEDPVEKDDKWASGVNNTYISFDGTNFDIYTTPVLVEEDGEHQLFYYSDDMVGNVEPVVGPIYFGIDMTPPTIVLTWDSENKIIIADVDDETSGIAKVEFYVNDEFVGEVTEEPWEWSYPEAKKGDKAQAIVYDGAGNSKVSEKIDPYMAPQGQSTPTVVVKQVLPQNI